MITEIGKQDHFYIVIFRLTFSIIISCPVLAAMLWIRPLNSRHLLVQSPVNVHF